MTKTIINGKPSGVIDINDRGFNYGDGFFTTAKVSFGEVQLWHLHHKRLEECAQRLGFGDLNFAAIEQDMATLLSGAPEQDAVLKIVITRGNGGRGYAPPSDVDATRIIRLLPFPENYAHLPKSGMSLSVAKTRLAQQPLLAGLKTLNRLEQVLVKQEAAQQHSDDVLVLDTNDNVIETSSANLLMYQQGQWYTPSLQQAGIQGVFLAHLQQQFDIVSRNVSLAELFSMEAVYCCNSLMGLVPISRIAHHNYNLDVSHSVLAQQGLSV
ncbi:aminodeoxychorismate lyase [Pseudoalteromonas sp. GB56]